MIFMVGIAAGIVCLYFIYEIFKEKTNIRSIGGIINVEQETPKEETIVLGAFSLVPGKNIYMFPIMGNQEYQGSSYYSKSATSIRNYLFYDIRTGIRTKLFDKNKGLIQDSFRIVDMSSGLEQKPVVSTLFEVILNDDDNNGILNDNDFKHLYLYAFNDEAPRLILRNIAGINGIHQIDNDKTVIFYEKPNDSVADVSVAVIDNLSGAIIKSDAILGGNTGS